MRWRNPALAQIEQLHSATVISAGAATSKRTRPQWQPPAWRTVAGAAAPIARNYSWGSPAMSQIHDMFQTTIAGSLPKPAWLAEPNKLWPAWRASGADLARAKRDATLLWLKEQEDAGIDIVTEGQQSGHHRVHAFVEFLEGIAF